MVRLIFLLFVISVLLNACAGERQGLVCEEMEYRLNTMAYSPDQRAYAEEELRVCREEEALKKADGAASRKSIYDRYGSKTVPSESAGTAPSADEVPADTSASDVSNFQ